MISRNENQSGDFTVFGFTREPRFIEQRLSARLGITPQTIEIGSVGQFFFYSSYGDVAESEEAVVLKLGFLRSTTKSALNAQQLLELELVKPRSIDTDAFSGNALVVGISKIEPAFSAFKTLMSVPQLYFSASSDGIFCSDVLRCVLRLIPHCELDESILPQHFLFRSVHGSFTYFQGVERLMPGQYLKWADGNIEIELKRSLDAVSDEAQYIRDDARALNLLYESLQAVVGDYTKQIEAPRQGMANLLSGGVDSTLIQFLINANSSQKPSRSISFSIQVPAFDFEVEYARQASRLLHTEHTFVNYTPQDYPGLLIRTIDILAQPPNLETEPSFLSIAEFVQAESWPEKYFFTGHGADSLFGEPGAVKLKGLGVIRRIPFAIPLLKGMGTFLMPIPARSHMMIRGAEILASESDPDAYISPVNSVSVYVEDQNWAIIRRCFGDRALREALANRRNLAAQYSNSCHHLDKVYFLDLLTDSYELGVQRQQLFLAHRLEQVFPFFDEDLLRLALTFHPDMRYIKGFRYKHLLKRLLAQKTNAPVAHKRKGPSTVNDDLVAWMRSSGPLRPMVEDIHRPDFMNKADFERLLRKPDYFLWPLLTLDIFQKRIIENQGQVDLPIR
jgi:asparagine synthetase B (glutamine-hydrolysing)